MKTPISPRKLSHEMRTSNSPYMKRRRIIFGLSLTTIGSMAVIALYQLGIIKHLPDPPLPYFNADKVDASEEAYARLSTPDAAIGLVNFAATAALAAMGAPDRAETRPWSSLAMTMKVGIDAVEAGRLTWNQWAKHKAFCGWCLLASCATFAQVPLVVPEARAAWRHISGS